MGRGSFRGLIGPTSVGTGFGTWLDSALSADDLHEAVIASAFLSEDAADQLLATLWLRPRQKTKPRVSVLVGTKERFTRKAAIRALMAYAVGKRAARSFPVVLDVRCPRDPEFHVKAAFVHQRRVTVAAVGSHNLTAAGLDASSELGVILAQMPATAVGKALASWWADSIPWTTAIRTYKEAKLAPRQRTSKAITSRGSASTHEVADAYRGDLPLTPREERQREQAVLRFISAFPDRTRRLAAALWQDGTRANAIAEDGYLRGARFGHADDISVAEWAVAQKRSILEVVDVIPTVDAKNCIILAKNAAKPFTVTRETRRVAMALGVTSARPSPVALAKFISFLKTGRLPR